MRSDTVVYHPCTALVYIAKQRWSLLSSKHPSLSSSHHHRLISFLYGEKATPRTRYMHSLLFFIFKTTENKKASLSLSLSPRASGFIRTSRPSCWISLVLFFLSAAWLGLLPPCLRFLKWGCERSSERALFWKLSSRCCYEELFLFSSESVILFIQTPNFILQLHHVSLQSPPRKGQRREYWKSSR